MTTISRASWIGYVKRKGEIVMQDSFMIDQNSLAGMR